MLFIMNEAGSECKGEQGEKEILDKQEGKILKERKNSVYQKRGNENRAGIIGKIWQFYKIMDMGRWKRM